MGVRVGAIIVFLAILLGFYSNNDVFFAETVEVHPNLAGAKPTKYMDGYVMDGRLMVPLREYSSVLNLNLSLKNDRLVVYNGKNSLEFEPNGSEYFFNGTKAAFENDIFTMNGKTYVQFLVIAKLFNTPFIYNNGKNWVEIETEDLDLVIFQKPETAMFKYEPSKITALMYHHFKVGDEGSGAVISPERFREHLSALKAEGYETITDFDIINYNKGKTKLPQKPLLITIDDGYLSNYLEAYPILVDHGYKATIYVVTSKVGTKPGWLEYMSWDQMRVMVASGIIDIQSHTDSLHDKQPETYSSRGYALVNYLDGEDKKAWKQRVRDDLRLSKQLIEENLGNEVVALAYPFGVYDKKVIDLLKEEGFELAYTIDQGNNTKLKDAYRIKRFTGDGSETGEQLLNKIEPFRKLSGYVNWLYNRF